VLENFSNKNCSYSVEQEVHLNMSDIDIPALKPLATTGPLIRPRDHHRSVQQPDLCFLTSEMALLAYSGAWEKLMHEKN
jgi:hypothetical protein